MRKEFRVQTEREEKYNPVASDPSLTLRTSEWRDKKELNAETQRTRRRGSDGGEIYGGARADAVHDE